MKRVKISHQYGEVYPNVFADYAWIRQHYDELLTTYGTCVLLVYQQQIVGTGKTLDEAVQDAEQRLAPEVEQITPVTEFLAPRHRFYRVHAAPSAKP